MITRAGDAACCIGGKRGANTVFPWVKLQGPVSFCSSIGCPGEKTAGIETKMPYPSEFDLLRRQNFAILAQGRSKYDFFFVFDQGQPSCTQNRTIARGMRYDLERSHNFFNEIAMLLLPWTDIFNRPMFDLLFNTGCAAVHFKRGLAILYHVIVCLFQHEKFIPHPGAWTSSPLFCRSCGNQL